MDRRKFLGVLGVSPLTMITMPLKWYPWPKPKNLKIPSVADMPRIPMWWREKKTMVVWDTSREGFLAPVLSTGVCPVCGCASIKSTQRYLECSRCGHTNIFYPSEKP